MIRAIHADVTVAVTSCDPAELEVFCGFNDSLETIDKVHIAVPV
jgi:hypothetical protein